MQRNKVITESDAATLQWANGKTMGRLTPGTGRFTPVVGFHIEMGKVKALDEAIATAEGLLAQGGKLTVQPIEIKHQRPGGAEIVKHWYFGEQVSLYPVTNGPVATTMAGCVSERNRERTADAGLGARWGDNERSKLAVRGYLDALLELNYHGLVQLSARSKMTDELLKALVDHVRVCEAADGLIDRVKHPEPVLLPEVALPLGPGPEAEWGKGDTATVVPLKSMHPTTIDAEYLRSLWRPDAVLDLALREWESVVEWAREYATQGEPQPVGAGATYETEEPPL